MALTGILVLASACMPDLFGGEGCGDVEGPFCQDQVLLRIENLPSTPGAYVLDGTADDRPFSCAWNVLADGALQGGGLCDGADYQLDPASGRLSCSDARGRDDRLRLEVFREGVSIGSADVQLEWRKETWYEDEGACALECYSVDQVVTLTAR